MTDPPLPQPACPMEYLRDLLHDVNLMLKEMMTVGEVRVLRNGMRECFMGCGPRVPSVDFEHAVLGKLVEKATELVKWRRMTGYEFKVLGGLVRRRLRARSGEEEKWRRMRAGCDCEYCLEHRKDL